MRIPRMIPALLAIALVTVSCAGAAETTTTTATATETTADGATTTMVPTTTEAETTTLAETTTVAETTSSAAPVEPQEFRMSFPSDSIINAAHEAAEMRGYYEEAGITFIPEFGRPDISVRSLVAGEHQAAGASVAALIAFLNQVPLRQVQVAYEDISFELWAQEEITDVSQLEGMRVGIEAPGTVNEVVVTEILASAGLEPGDVELVAVGPVPQWFGALQGGTVEASILANVEQQVLAEKEGFNRLVPASDVVPMFLSGISVNQSLIDEDPDLIQRFVTATHRGLLAYLEDPEFGVEVVKEASGLSDEDAQRAYELDVAHRSLNGKTSDETMLSTMEVLAQVLNLNPPQGVEDAVDWTFIDNAIEEYGSG